MRRLSSDPLRKAKADTDIDFSALFAYISKLPIEPPHRAAKDGAEGTT